MNPSDENDASTSPSDSKVASTHFDGQRTGLIVGINVGEPVVTRLHTAYREERFSDWPTIILATTIQTSALSLLRLLPSEPTPTSEPLDVRSIASIIRNIIDTHDTLDMLTNTTSADEWNLHRDIMGLYLSARFHVIGSKVAASDTKMWEGTADWYWKRIRKSSLYSPSMRRLRSGETIFYMSRNHRVQKACGEDAQLVAGILSELSTYVHSMPPTVWMSDISELYSDSKHHRDVVGVWLRVVNFYIARSFTVVTRTFPEGLHNELAQFIKHHETVFSRKATDAADGAEQ